LLKAKYFLDEDEQALLFQKILHFLSTGSRVNKQEWPRVRTKLLWLWGWGKEKSKSPAGDGVFGRMNRSSLEKDILEGLVSSGCGFSVNTTIVFC
jgi:protein transport protein SEC39